MNWNCTALKLVEVVADTGFVDRQLQQSVRARLHSKTVNQMIEDVWKSEPRSVRYLQCQPQSLPGSVSSADLQESHFGVPVQLPAVDLRREARSYPSLKGILRVRSSLASVWHFQSVTV